MRLLALLGFLFTVLTLSAAEAASEPPLSDGLYAEFTTARGTFVARLFADRAPMTVTNFVALAEGKYAQTFDGRPNYQALSWYRVVPGFVIQGGAEVPPERFSHYPFPDEFAPGLRHDKAGVLSMANGGPDTNDAVFFITLDDATRLNYLHTVFGYVERGREVLSLIQRDDPFSVRILRVGPEAQKFVADKTAFLSLAATAVRYKGAPDIGPKSHFDDPDKILPTDAPRAKNFNYKLANFERATGRRLYSRVFARFAPTSSAKTPEAFAQELASSLNLKKDGVLALYFADLHRWVLAVGTERRKDLTSGSETLEAALARLQAEADKLAQSYAENMIKIRGQDNLTASDRLKYSVDAMLDALIPRLEPRN